MAIAYKKKKTRGRNRILELLLPKMIRETRCTECGRPFLEHPEREPNHRFEQNGVELFLYEDRSNIVLVHKLRVGVWRLSQDGYYFSQLFSRENIDDLQRVILDAVEFVSSSKEEKEE